MRIMSLFLRRLHSVSAPRLMISEASRKRDARSFTIGLMNFRVGADFQQVADRFPAREEKNYLLRFIEVRREGKVCGWFPDVSLP